MTAPRKADAPVARGEGGQAGTTTSAKSTASEQPEHRNDRRRFLTWALMLGAIPPERVVERVLADVLEESGR